MKIVKVFDDKNYDENWPRINRNAVRAIIINNNKIGLIRSEKEGYYKFPGGGIEAGETHLEALIRETKEEAGLTIIPSSIKEFGMIQEIRKAIFETDNIFDQKSYYYFVQVENEVVMQKLEAYEVELGYVLEWTSLEAAYNKNMELAHNYKSKFILREAEILKLVIGSKNYKISED